LFLHNFFVKNDPGSFKKSRDDCPDLFVVGNEPHNIRLAWRTESQLPKETRMNATSRLTPLDKERFDAVLFDLDGVITATNKNHFAAWKTLFDSYLKKVSQRDNTPFKEFSEEEMSEYVDGRPRYEGIRNFLEYRGIAIPYGDIEDDEEQETIYGLGNLKNRFFNESIEADGVTIFDKSVELIKRLKDKQIRCAVVSSSKNCSTVLKSAGLTDLFEVQVDGVVAAEMKLVGKPTPDTYLKAAELLGVSAERAVVVEDAISGVQAGRAGNFGLVIGVDRVGQADALSENGADVVVTDLGDFLV
jgi:beta-phosphoglucomutase family hydrolase